MHIYINTALKNRTASDKNTFNSYPKGVIKQLMGIYSTTQIKYYKQTRKLENQSFQRYS